MRPFEVKDKGGLNKYSAYKSQYLAQNRHKISFAKIDDDLEEVQSAA